MKKHLIIIDRSLNSKVGGGRGYLYKLKQGLDKLGIDDFIVISKNEKFEIKQNLKNKLKNLYIFKLLLKIYRFFNAIKYYMYLCKLDKQMPSKEIIDKIREYDFDSIHCHHPFEFIMMLNYLKYNDKDNVIKFFTCHDPGLTSDEIYMNFKSINKYIANLIKEKTRKIEKIAFNNSDVLIFPCYEALDYYRKYEYYEKLLDNKEKGYVLTGTDEYKVTISNDDYRKNLNIDNNAIVFSFLGRHNEIKGFDILKSAANIVLKEKSSIYFLIGGEEGPLYGLKNKRWVEMGFTLAPGNLVNASDVFIAPNRKAYFDLVIIEAMSIGKVVIATRTGGNIKMASLSEGILLVEQENIEDLKNMILKVANMSKEELRILGEKNKEAYKKYFTLEKFASNYVELINELKYRVKNDR